MRRAIAIAALALLLAGCSTTERPEGIVERWLLALNQGQAGEPRRYGFPGVSEEAAKNWRTADPGAFDVIEVGPAHGCSEVGPIVCEAAVPFRIVLIDGRDIQATALVGIDRMGNNHDPITSRVFGVIRADANASLPSEGGPSIGSAATSAWFASLAIAVGLMLLGEGAMRLARRGYAAARRGTTPPG